MERGTTTTWRSYILDGFILVVLVACVYGRTLGNDFLFNWDDNLYVLNNPAVRGLSWAHLRSAFSFGSIGQYNPLSILSFVFDYTLWGLNPAGFHLTSIVIHAANGLLVYRLLRRWFDDRLPALVGAALFLIHPVQVESVAWISERKGLLSVFFCLLAWGWYDRYRAAAPGRGRLAYAASVIAYILSLLAKTVSVVLPVVLILYDHCFPAPDRKRRFLDKLPFVLAAALFSWIEMYSELPTNGGARVGYHGGSPLATFYTMLPVFCRYLRLLVWPSGLSVEHWPPVHRFPDATVVGAALILLCVAAGTAWLYRTDRRLGFWGIFFWVGLLPVSQIVPIFLLMYEHYLYLPMVGVAALAGAGAAYLRGRLGASRSVMLYAFIVLWLLALSVVSWQRAGVWRDSLTLFSDAARKDPEGFRAWWVLGGAYARAGRTDAAIGAYERSLALKPDSTDVLWSLGDLCTRAGELDKGYRALRRLLAINPTYVMGWATLGDNYFVRGEYAEAEKAYRRAAVLQPDALPVTVALGRVALVTGRLDEARALLGQVEAKRGNDPECAYLLAGVEARSGHLDAALWWLDKAFASGFADYDRASTDKTLSPLWNDPRFNYLLLKYFPAQAGSK